MTDIQSFALNRRSVLRGSVTIAGAAVILPTFATLGGCSTAPANLEKHRALIAAIVGRIIPETDTPGAVAAGVPGYIVAVFDQHFTGEQQRDFVDGLDAIAEIARREGVADFTKAPVTGQDAVLKALADASEDQPAKQVWRHLHDMTVFGFYTAEAATQELAYEEIPGRQIGCLPFEEVGRAWLDRGV